LNNVNLIDRLTQKEISISIKKIFDHSKADSGGERDLKFLKYLIDSKLLNQSEHVLKRSSAGINEEYYLERYKKMNFESDKHFLCRTAIQDELKKLEIDSFGGIDVGNMNILRSNANYDIVTEDFSSIIDIGLTPARNYFRGLTDLKVKHYLITSYFDDYMDDVIFSCFTRSCDEYYLNAVRDYEEGFKIYTPDLQPDLEDRNFY
jgi:hypothetical protein